ncbi:phage major tail tube protein, partial [Klebsiella aerogenes]
MSDKNTLRVWTFFRQGVRIQGAHEFTPPALSIVKTDLRTGAQDAPTPVDDGMEALTCQVKFYGIDTDMLTAFGFVSGKRYPEEFKIEAVKQVIDRGHSVSSVATRLDITTHS